MNYKIVVTMSIFLAFVSTASIQIDEEDYNSLMKLLQESDDDENTYNTYNRYPRNDDNDNDVESSVNSVNEVSYEFPVGESESTGQVSTGLDISSMLSYSKPSFGSVLSAPTEVLSLIETFLQLKSQFMSKMSNLILDNFDLIKSVFRVFSLKMTKLNGFTLKGISVLRKVLEFALQAFGTWNSNKPSFAFNLGIDKDSVYNYT